jgi:hypothetical protein
LKDEEFDLTKEDELEEEKEPHTPVSRRSVWERRRVEMCTPPNFHFSFS